MSNRITGYHSSVTQLLVTRPMKGKEVHTKATTSSKA